MNVVPSIPTTINVAIISQYKCIQDIRTSNFSGGQVLNKTLPNLLRTIRKSLQNGYNVNPNNPALVPISEYLFALSAPYSQYALGVIANKGGSLPVITGPANQAGNVGFNAVFSVSVTGSGPFIYAWFRNGVLVPGATTSTLPVPNAQLTDSGSQFFVTVTNASGTQVSNTATLTVTANLQGQWYAGSTDYSTQLLAGIDVVPYNGTFSITDGQPFNVPFPIGQSYFVVIKYPNSQALRVHYANPVAGIDQAGIPGLAFDQNGFGGNNYTFSRNGNPFGINNTTGIVQFS